MASSANTYLQVTELDFEEIKSNLKNFLSTQTQFKDYDYDGASMNVLLDLLSYNTHYNAFYINMLANEMFLDTSQQRDSVVSHAKKIGYTPLSTQGATANVQITFTNVLDPINFSVTNGIPDKPVPEFTLPKYTKFSTTVDDVPYTFVTTEPNTIKNVSYAYTKPISIKEGVVLTHRFTVNTANPDRYIIPNQNVDTTSITVQVQESSSDTTKTSFNKASSVSQVLSTSNVYFLEEAYDNKYEIIFGDGILGKALKHDNIIEVTYIVSHGNESENASVFNHNITASEIPTTVLKSGWSATVTTNNNAFGGRNQESIESIKFNAPRNFQTQNRAIIKNDYSRIILSENSDLQSVIAYGGEEAESPIYGKVYIAVKPFSESYTTSSRKSQIKESISDRTPLAVDPIIIDPVYTYIIPQITTYYDKTKSLSNVSSLQQEVRDGVYLYSTNNLERFGSNLRYSKFIRTLDDSTSSVVLNNDATIFVEQRFVPITTSVQKITVNFNNAIRTGSVNSTSFTYKTFTCFLDDDSLGNVRIYRFDSSAVKTIIESNTGTVDYTTGKIILSSFFPTAISGIEMVISSQPVSFDVRPVREQILIMNPNDATINLIGEI